MNMLVFASKFPLAESTIETDILDRSIGWLCGSRHHKWKKEDLVYDASCGSVQTFRNYEQEVKMGILDSEPGRLAAFKHSWASRDSLEWTTEVTCLFRDGHSPSVCIRLHCSTNLAGVQIPKAKKPVLVGQLLEQLSGGDDGLFTVGDAPHELADLDTAVDIVNGNANTELPIVYISSERASDAYVDKFALARRLSGLAHVVVEPSREFSFQLRNKTNGRNTYGGAVGVYWSSGSGLHARYLPSKYRPGDLEEAVVCDICQISCESRIDSYLTWSAVEQAESRARILELRSSDSADVNEYIEAFDKELAAKDEENQAANKEILRLQNQIMRIQSSVHLGGGVLKAGNESDLYTDEVLQIVVEALRNQSINSRDGSRAKHVLDDLVEANPVSDTRAQYISEIKSLLSSGGKIGNKEIGQLEIMGFSVTSDGKHHKAVFASDNRYQFTLPKTASDYRAGKNIVSDIVGALFK